MRCAGSIAGVETSGRDGETVGGRWVRRLGWLLLAVGALIFVVVAYELWGTGLLEDRSQRALRSAFERQIAAADVQPPPGRRPEPQALQGGEEDVATTAPAMPRQPPPVPPAIGEPIGILRIPKPELDKVVVEGTDEAALATGPGHEPSTPLPGQPGNAVVAGHRTTYGAPFSRLDELAPGDAVFVQTAAGEFRYTVTASQVVEPSDTWVLAPTADDRLTLFTCTPRCSAENRLVVTARFEATTTRPTAAG